MSSIIHSAQSGLHIILRQQPSWSDKPDISCKTSSDHTKNLKTTQNYIRRDCQAFHLIFFYLYCCLKCKHPETEIKSYRRTPYRKFSRYLSTMKKDTKFLTWAAWSCRTDFNHFPAFKNNKIMFRGGLLNRFKTADQYVTNPSIKCRLHTSLHNPSA